MYILLNMKTTMLPTNGLSLDAYAQTVRLSQLLDGQYDLTAALRYHAAPKGDNTTATIAPKGGAR